MTGLFDNLGHGGKKEPLVGRICYVFNTELDGKLNDTVCIHCRKFMTLDCERIDEFMDGDDP